MNHWTDFPQILIRELGNVLSAWFKNLKLSLSTWTGKTPGKARFSHIYYCIYVIELFSIEPTPHTIISWNLNYLRPPVFLQIYFSSSAFMFPFYITFYLSYKLALYSNISILQTVVRAYRLNSITKYMLEISF